MDGNKLSFGKLPSFHQSINHENDSPLALTRTIKLHQVLQSMSLELRCDEEDLTGILQVLQWKLENSISESELLHLHKEWRKQSSHHLNPCQVDDLAHILTQLSPIR